MNNFFAMFSNFLKILTVPIDLFPQPFFFIKCQYFLCHLGTDTKDTPYKSQTDQELSDIIDPLMESMDKNSDGFVNYAEFRSEMIGE